MRPENPDTHTHLDANGTPYEHAHAPADAHLDADTDEREAPTGEERGRDVLHPRSRDVLR
jgi:hypothetical protein